ncbi:MAG: PQQ-dependent sugar dehydrogenase [Chloroflexi bacterium]|nr:MAG: PQQ-dependent sugar dehydrogenase [Chloroflexota bacterium]
MAEARRKLGTTTMTRAVSACLLFLALCLLTLIAGACSGGGDNGDDNPFGIKSEVVTPAANADAIEFAPDGRLFFVEHWTGAIRVVGADGKLLADPFFTLTDVTAGIGWGLSGLAIDPSFATNHYVYALYTQLVRAGPPTVGKPVVVRLTDNNNVGTDQLVLVSNLPETDPEHPFNANGSLHFGPDGRLYFTLGDYDKAQALGPTGKPLSQDLGTPIGKMLRVNKEDGSPPPDNPFVRDPSADPRIYAYGFRGAINFTVNPKTKRIYAIDNTGLTCEGVVTIEAGANYAWPNVGTFPFNDCAIGRTQTPLGYLTQQGRRPEDFQSAPGSTGTEFISGSVYKVLGDSLVVCESGTQLLRRLVLAPPNFDKITANDVIAKNCWLDVTVGPDGLVYYANLTEIRRLPRPPESPSPSQS